MVEHTLRTVHESLVQGYCATADCATGDCARLCDKRYYCTTEKKKNTTSYACNRINLQSELNLCLALFYGIAADLAQHSNPLSHCKAWQVQVCLAMQVLSQLLIHSWSISEYT